jgi:hypothetical protein
MSPMQNTSVYANTLQSIHSFAHYFVRLMNTTRYMFDTCNDMPCPFACVEADLTQQDLGTHTRGGWPNSRAQQ